MQKTTPLRPHKVLGRTGYGGRDIHALMLTEGLYAGIVFSYSNVSFKEDPENDVLRLGFEYEIHEVPQEVEGFDKKDFQKELGDFIVELLYYGLERDKLGFIDGEQNREDDSIESYAQRSVLPQGSTIPKD
jgi:hypothetical protein